MDIEGVKGLFSLKNLNSRYHGYYMNAKGEVFSTKQFATPKKLSGTKNFSGHYYTLDGGNVRADTLLQLAKSHKSFAEATTPDELRKAVVTSAPSDGLPAEVGVQEKGYVIAQVQSGQLVFGSKPKIHRTLDSVRTEVERLAAKSPGTQIVYLQIKGAAVAKGIHWV